MPLKVPIVMSEFAKLAVAAILIYSAIEKLINHNAFQASMTAARVSPLLATIVSKVLPVVEVVVAGLLSFNKTRDIGIQLSIALFIVFIAYILYMQIWLTDLPCSCGGLSSGMSWNEQLSFNIIIFFLLIYVKFISGKQKCLSL